MVSLVGPRNYNIRARGLHVHLPQMAHFHCWTRIQIRTQIWIPNSMATLYYAEHVSTDSDSDSDPFAIVSE